MPDTTSARQAAPTASGSPAPSTAKRLGARLGARFGSARRGLRCALPALTAYAGVRALGVLLVVAWGRGHHIAPITRLGTLWDAGWYARIADHGYSRTDGL